MKLKAQIAFLKNETRMEAFGFATALPKSLMVYLVGELLHYDGLNFYSCLIPLPIFKDNKSFISIMINAEYLLNTKDVAELDYNILGSDSITETKSKRPIKINEQD